MRAKLRHTLCSFQGIGVALILFIHAILFFVGFDIIDIRYYWQFMDWDLMNDNLFESILFYHANPPGLSLLHFLADKLSLGNPQLFWRIILPLLHGIAFISFNHFCSKIKLSFKNWICAILFFNPLIFIYFKYPFYSTFIFLTSILLLKLLFSQRKKGELLIWISLILSFNCLLRSSWHIFIISTFLFLLWPKTPIKHKIISICILIFPLSIYVKNAVFFDKFTSSTWLGMNLYFHIDPKGKDLGIYHIGRFQPINQYKDFIPLNSQLAKKYPNNTYVNRGDFNDIRFIDVSEAFMEELKNNYSLSHSLPTLVDGYCRFMDSPSNYSFLFENTGLKIDMPVFVYDIFDLPNPQKGSPHFKKGFSIYLFIYSLAAIILLIYFRKLSFQERWTLLLCLLMSSLYFSIDYAESNRMRFEIEPFWYAISIWSLQRIFPKTFVQK